MTITLEINPEIQAKLERQAAARSMALETHALNLLEQAASNMLVDPDRPAITKEGAMAAGARIRELSKGVTLGDLTIRELIDEGRP